MMEFARWLHLLAAGVWLGGLVMLALTVMIGLRTLAREDSRRLVRSLGRAFLGISLVAWPVLGVTGWILARDHLSGWDQLRTTAFGQALGVKIVLSAVVVLTAGLHTLAGRSSRRPLIALSRVLAVMVFLETLAVFWLAARLGELP